MSELSRLGRVADRLAIPPEAVSGTPRIVISGPTRVRIEGHRGLLEFSRERIAAACAGCRVLIRGEELGLEAMSGRDLVVTGRLWAVELE